MTSPWRTQSGIQPVNYFGPVRVFQKFFAQQSRLRWCPEWRIGQQHIGRQWSVGLQELPDACRVHAQTKLGKQFREAMK